MTTHGTLSTDAGSPLSTAELLAAAHVVAIPTRTRFRGIEVREAVVFDAPAGASEFSPFLEYGDAEAATWLAAAIDFGWAGSGGRPALPVPLRDSVEVNATIPAVSPEEVPKTLARFPGCTTAKVKVAEPGETLEDDVARVRAVREAMGSDARIRIDANGGWSVEEATRALTALAEFHLDYTEQPCRTVAELAEVRRRVGTVRIAADESVRKADDPLAVVRAGAADLLIVKAQPLGGVQRALDIVTEANLPVVVSSALDTSVGISMGVHLAAALPEHLLAGACGLGTAVLLAGDVTQDPLTPAQGRLDVRRPLLDPGLVARFAASPERTDWWRERVARCHRLLTSSH
ncbi:MAG: o-succinylbenzoate synthase [Leucobacter sp.]